MTPFTIAGIQMKVSATQSNVEMMKLKLDICMNVYPAVDLVLFSELCGYGPLTYYAQELPGHFETEMHLRYPDSSLFIRNMADPGNTPGFRPHSGRYSPWAFPGAEKFQTEMAMKLAGEWPQQVTMLNFRADHARIYFQGFPGQVLADLGFERPKEHMQDVWGMKLTSKESIPSMNADAAFIFMEEDPAVLQTYEQWTAHPLWQTLDSVNDNAVYLVDQVAWNMAGGPLAARQMLQDIRHHYGLD